MGRRTGRRKALGVAVVAALALLALGLAAGVGEALAGSSPAPSSSPGALTLRLGWTTEPDNLNPFIGYLAADYEIYYLNYDMLVDYDAATLQLRPDLAVSWSHSADGLTWTFHIRKGVTWQDGVPLTARDVAFSFDYVVKNQLSNYLNYATSIKSAVATDDTTVVFHLTQPKSTMLESCSGMSRGV